MHRHGVGRACLRTLQGASLVHRLNTEFEYPTQQRCPQQWFWRILGRAVAGHVVRQRLQVAFALFPPICSLRVVFPFPWAPRAPHAGSVQVPNPLVPGE